MFGHFNYIGFGFIVYARILVYTIYAGLLNKSMYWTGMGRNPEKKRNTAGTDQMNDFYVKIVYSLLR
jgi:hypothetical protein